MGIHIYTHSHRVSKWKGIMAAALNVDDDEESVISPFSEFHVHIYT